MGTTELKRLQAAFEKEGAGEDAEPLQLERDEFFALCKKVKCPKPWDQLFQHLDSRGNGCVSWEDVRFIEEQWNWTGASPTPIRGIRGSPGSSMSRSMSRSFRPDSPPRTEGLGPLATSMRPRKVTLQKSISLPSLEPEIRANWNDRHHILDTSSNKNEQLLHLMAYVQTQEQQHIARRCKKKLVEVPTHEWLEVHMAMQEEEGL